MPENHNFRDEQFMSAAEKEKVLRAWTRFLKSGCAKPQFTEALYHHLNQHCSFIAHYDRHGFFAFYFECPSRNLVRFFDQFDPDLPGISAEYGGTGWLSPHMTGADLSQAMREAARPYLANLRQQFGEARRQWDISTARTLLAAHGLTVAEAPSATSEPQIREVPQASVRSPIQSLLFTD